MQSDKHIPKSSIYGIYPMFWDNQAWANRVDQDKMPHNLIWVYTETHPAVF